MTMSSNWIFNATARAARATPATPATRAARAARVRQFESTSQSSPLPLSSHSTLLPHLSRRSYLTRAHPKPLPTTPISTALQTLLDEYEGRHVKRERRWHYYLDQRVQVREEYLRVRGRVDDPDVVLVQGSMGSMGSMGSSGNSGNSGSMGRKGEEGVESKVVDSEVEEKSDSSEDGGVAELKGADGDSVDDDVDDEESSETSEDDANDNQLQAKEEVDEEVELSAKQEEAAPTAASTASTASTAPTTSAYATHAKSTPYRRMDETVSLALQLNLDPRKPGQSLRGSLSLPHGNGKTFRVAVFTNDPALARAALEGGAVFAGGIGDSGSEFGLIEKIKSGMIPLNGIDRAIATGEMMPHLSSIARLLGPRGLMPNPKLNTIVKDDQLLETLASQRSGVSNYRTDKVGIVRVGVGKTSFGREKLLENIRELMEEIQSVKPESFGKGKGGKGGKGGKKAGKGTKYYLKAHLSCTQSGKGWAIDLRSLDPTSSHFMSVPPNS